MQNVTPVPCKQQHRKSHTGREENGNTNFITIGIVSPAKAPVGRQIHPPNASDPWWRLFSFLH